MAKVVPAEKLGAAIKEILDEYGDEVSKDVVEVTKQIAKEGQKALRQSSRQNIEQGEIGKAYASGWKTQMTEGRGTAEVIFYNASKPGLTHLLEHGHALWQGGRAKAIPHIAPVEETLVREFEQEITAKLQKG